MFLINLLLVSNVLAMDASNSSMGGENRPGNTFTCPTADMVANIQHQKGDVGQFTMEHDGLEFLVQNEASYATELNVAYGGKSIYQGYHYSCDYATSTPGVTLKIHAEIPAKNYSQANQCKLQGPYPAKNYVFGYAAFKCKNDPRNCQVICPVMSLKEMAGKKIREDKKIQTPELLPEELDSLVKRRD